jgi:agmatinase
MKTIKRTYAGIPEEFGRLEAAKVVLIPVPFDATSTWGKGSDKGPAAFLEASENMELYDIETDTEVYEHGVYLTDAIDEKSNPEILVKKVHEITKTYINKKKFVTLIGGEHTLSIGSIRAFNECFDNLTVLQIDAHADLRPEYNGSAFNHACAVYEASQTANLIQVGIRSMDSKETGVMNPDKTFFAHEMATNEYWMEDAIDQMTRNVFITFDLDALDPSIMPSTGTPEPGGLLWYETLDFLRKVFDQRNVVGFDLVELCPDGVNKQSEFLAAKLYYKMLSYKYCEAQTKEDSDDLNNETPFSKLSKFKDTDNYD